MSRYIVLLEDKVRLQVLYGFSPVHYDADAFFVNSVA